MAYPFVYVLAVMSMTYYHGSDPGHVNVYISGNDVTDVIVEYPWSRDPVHVTLNAANGYRWNVSNPMATADRNLAAVKGIRVRATGVVNVQVSRGKMSLTNIAAYTAIPLTSDSTDFYLSSRRNSSRGMTKAKPLVIIGASDEPAQFTLSRQSGSIVLSDSLAAGEVREVYADRTTGDLTGYRLTSTAPVVVYSGHQCGNVPNDEVYCEPILQQIPPMSLIGEEYVAGPILFRGRAGYTVRVVVTENSTDVMYQTEPGSLTVTLVNIGAAARCSLRDQAVTCETPLQAGDFLDFRTTNASWPMSIQCSKPCYAYQFNHGGAMHNRYNLKTDPFMSVLTPLDAPSESFARFSTISSYSRNNVLILRNFLTVIAPTDVTFELDGAASTSDSKQVRAWRIYSVEVDHGFHEVRVPSGDRVVVQVYGHGPVDDFSGQTAYGFPATFSASKLESVVYTPTIITTKATTSTTRKTTPSTATTPTTSTTIPTTTTTTLTTTTKSTTSNPTATHETTRTRSSTTMTPKPRTIRQQTKLPADDDYPESPTLGDGLFAQSCGEGISLEMFIALIVIGVLILIVMGQAIALGVLNRRRQPSKRLQDTIPKHMFNTYMVTPGPGARDAKIDDGKPPNYDNVVNDALYMSGGNPNYAYDDVVVHKEGANPNDEYDDVIHTGNYDVPKGSAGVYEYIPDVSVNKV